MKILLAIKKPCAMTTAKTRWTEPEKKSAWVFGNKQSDLCPVQVKGYVKLNSINSITK